MRDEIKTDRLVLRRVKLEDAPAFSRLGSEFEVARMTGSFPYPFPLISAEFKIMDLIAQYRQGLAYPYAITLDGHALMGIADIFKRSADADFEIGYWIGKPYWGRGYISEACQAVIKEAQKTLGIRRMVAGVFHDNPASMNVLTKLGFKATGKSGMYFSMARLKKAKSLDFALDLAAPRSATPLRISHKTVIDA